MNPHEGKVKIFAARRAGATDIGLLLAYWCGVSEREDGERMVEVRHGPVKPVEEGEIITEENVYDRPDETMGFFPGQVAVDLISSALLLAVVVALSYLVPAPLTEPMDISTDTYVPRPEWFFMFYDQ